MAKDNIRKIKVLKLLEHLRQNTDESHPLTAGQIAADLAAMGIPFDPRTISQDIVVLNELGYEIMSTMVGHEKRYYVADRSFSVPELRILIDAIQAASFITPRKSEELINKVAALGGSYRADILTRNMVCFNTRKHNNERIYYNVDSLEDAILRQKKVIFRYFDINETGKRIYRREGHRYVVEPIALVFNEDNYYLTCYSAKHDNTSNYRIDRMEAVQVLDEDCCEKAVMLRDQVSDYTEQAFKMFGGQLEEVVLQFDLSLIGAVYDRFGENTKIELTDNNCCIARVPVQISPVFWGWLFQFAGQMNILSPEHIAEDYINRAKLVSK